MARKTVHVEYVVNRGNMMIENTFSREERLALIIFVEDILHATGNYRGFEYLPSELDEMGRLKSDYDDTMRRYIYRA